MKKIYRIITLLAVFFLFAAASSTVFAYQPTAVFYKKGEIKISNPEVSQLFYDELQGTPRNYFITSNKNFNLYINLLVPELANREGRYSAKVFLINGDVSQQIAELNGDSSEWQGFYDKLGRDWYLKGPELNMEVSAGQYRIEVFSKDNLGKYVLSVGKEQFFDAYALLNVCWQLPLLKILFLKTSVLQFFLTPFGIGTVGAIGIFLIFAAFIYYIIGTIREFIKHNQAKTLLLTSAGMQMKDEIVKLLQKPAYDITVAFISTASKPKDDLAYLKKDWTIMRDEMGFNLQEIDIEGKKEQEVMELLKLKDIIFVEGGNTFYLLKAMRACNFEKIIRKLLKEGKVYIGVSAGSIVAGKTIQTAGWKNGDQNIVGLKNLKGLNLVPFDIFVHYRPEHAEIIKQKMKSPRKRARKLRILTDEQAILVQGREVALIGKGEKIIV